LQYAWQAQEYPGALPNPGGLRQQPVNLLIRMRVCLNVWSAFRDYERANMDTKWITKNPEKWKMIVIVMDMRAARNRGEL